MGMDNVIGHDKVKQILRNSIAADRVSHAYIFEGAAGIGRLTLAKAFAEELVGGAADSHPDIIVVTNQLYDSSKEQTNILVSTIRAMKADVYIRPYSGERKVYIIPNADGMQAAAQNSLLKVFEEPPPYCTIILIAANSDALLQTIRSRAQLLRMHPLDAASVVRYLTEVSGIDGGTAESLAAMSGGSIGKALSLSEDEDAAKMRSEVIEYLIKLSGSGVRPLYDFIKFLKKNEASVQFILNIMSDWSSDVLHMKLGGDILNSDRTEELKAFCSHITRESALRFGEIVERYSFVLSKNANYPIAVQCMATEYWEEIHGGNYRSALQQCREDLLF